MFFLWNESCNGKVNKARFKRMLTLLIHPHHSD